MISFRGKLFIYDIFIRDGKLYLVSTYYTKSDPPVRVYANNRQLTEVGHNEYEPVRYFIGDAPTNPLVTIRIEDDKTKPFTCSAIAEYVETTHGRMAVATLFKHDYKRIPTYCAYYRTQGVEKFFLYYNGPTLPDDIYYAYDIEYRCWDYPYWNPGAYPINRPETVDWAHNAQTTFITSICLRNLPRYDWFGFVDLDELIKHPSKPLRKHLETDISPDIQSVISRCHWGERLDDTRIRYTHSYVSEIYEGRAKVFYRSIYNDLCGIHFPKSWEKSMISNDLCLIHYIDEYDPDSSSRIERLQAIIEPTSILRLPVIP